MDLDPYLLTPLPLQVASHNLVLHRHLRPYLSKTALKDENKTHVVMIDAAREDWLADGLGLRVCRTVRTPQ